MSACGYCGHNPACGFAAIDGVRFCHGDCPHEPERPSCYEMTSVAQLRAIASDLAAPDPNPFPRIRLWGRTKETRR